MSDRKRERGGVLHPFIVQDIRNKALRGEITIEDLMDLISSHERLRVKVLFLQEKLRHD